MPMSSERLLPSTPPRIDPALLAADPAAAVRALLAEREAWFRSSMLAHGDALSQNRTSSRLIDSWDIECSPARLPT